MNMPDAKPDSISQPGPFWDEKYRGTDYFYGVWLAEQGHSVVAVDASWPRMWRPTCAKAPAMRGGRR